MCPGAGHSNAYEDPGAYSWAVKYILSTDSPIAEVGLKVEDFSARDAKNDYELPWILRGVMDDPAVKLLFDAEIVELKENILNWQPTTRALRDIKKRVSTRSEHTLGCARLTDISSYPVARAHGRSSGAASTSTEGASAASDILILVSCII